jgi:hypothetical protein
MERGRRSGRRRRSGGSWRRRSGGSWRRSGGSRRRHNRRRGGTMPAGGRSGSGLAVIVRRRG